MRALLAGACSVVLLSACGGTVPGAPGDPAGSPARADAGPAGATTTTCTSPEGFRVEHPADWHVNPGDVLPPCSWFDADSFVVPRASDARPAHVTLSVRSASDLSARWTDEEARRVVDVAGRPGLRVEEVTGPGFYPAGTPIVTYVVDLDPGAQEGRVLVADAVGLPGSDHGRDVEVLDAMMASLVLTGASRL
jgi:hypothetical protein